MKTVCIIQARLGSTRLPGKVLADVCGKPMLQRVVDRVRECDMVDEVVVATPNDNDHLLKIGPASVGALHLMPTVDDEGDVLARYASAADRVDAGIVVRITGDCPLVCPELIDKQVRDWLQVGWYVGPYPNHARGAMGEVLGARWLRQANRQLATKPMREHVTLPLQSPATHSNQRWCVDEEADLDFVRAVYGRLDDPLADYHTIAATVRHYSLAQINAHVKQKEVGE